MKRTWMDIIIIIISSCPKNIPRQQIQEIEFLYPLSLSIHLMSI